MRSPASAMGASHLFLVALHSAFFPMIPPLNSDERGLFVPHTATTVSVDWRPPCKKHETQHTNKKLRLMLPGEKRLSRHEVLFFFQSVSAPTVGAAATVTVTNHRWPAKAGHTLRGNHCDQGLSMKEMSPPSSEHNSSRGSSFPRYIFIQESHGRRTSHSNASRPACMKHHFDIPEAGVARPARQSPCPGEILNHKV